MEHNKQEQAKDSSGSPSCSTCYYSSNGKHSCDRHMNAQKPDYSKGVECFYNNLAHYRPFDKKTQQ